MSTLRESAEKIVAETLKEEGFSMTCCTECRYGYVDAKRSALSAVLKGMKLVLQGTPHLAPLGDDRHAYLTHTHVNRDGTTDVVEEKQCKLIGGACRVRDLE